MSDNPQEDIRPSKRFKLLHGLKKDGQTYTEGEIALPCCKHFISMASSPDIYRFRNSKVTLSGDDFNVAKQLLFNEVNVITILVTIMELVKFDGLDKVTIDDLKSMQEFETDYLYELYQELRKESGEKLRALNAPLRSASG
jgi:hypothetical protein